MAKSLDVVQGTLDLLILKALSVESFHGWGISARIQELYGINGKFFVGHGRVPVKIEVLAPNQRPIQVTDDLTAFWRDMYPKVKAELSRRYPRHEWR